MIISLCVNPECPNPKNHPKLLKCNSCGSDLVLNERYRVIKLLGKGGFGTTFVGVDLTVVGDPLCVVKQLQAMAENEKAFEMSLSLFQREAKTLGKINHPQIPKLMDYFVNAEHFYLIQELVNGENLQKEVKTNGAFSELAVKKFLEEIVPVIQYIHSEKVIHRDIKPANILKRKKDGKLILIDFGAVKDQVNTQLAKTYGQTALTKFAVGTMGYAPPEQLAMRPIYSSDIYALGATCIYLLTAKSPKKFEKDPKTGLLLWQKDLNIGRELATIINKMLEPDPRKRFKTADELWEALNLSHAQESFNDKIAVRQNTPVQMSDIEDLGVDINQEDYTNSQFTSVTSVTERLEKAVQQRRQKIAKSNNNVSVRWTEETFLESCANGNKDYSNQNLSNLNLQGIKLIKYVFRKSNLSGIVLPSANLYKANFYRADLTNADLSEANLSQASLTKSNLQNADLERANLSGADLTNANLTNVNLYGANLKHAKVNKQQVNSAKVNWKTILPNGKRKWWKFF